MNIFGLGGLGTIVSANADSKGYNWLALFVGLMQMSLVICGLTARQYYDPGQGLRFIPYAMVMIGWCWGIVHAKRVMEWTFDRFEDGKAPVKEVVRIKDQKDLVIDKSHFIRSAEMDKKYPVTKVKKTVFLSERLFRNYKDAAKKLDHPNLSLPIGFYKDADNYNIVHRVPCPDCVNLQEFMDMHKHSDPLSEQQVAHIAYQLFLALHHS